MSECGGLDPGCLMEKLRLGRRNVDSVTERELAKLRGDEELVAVRPPSATRRSTVARAS